MNNKELIKNAFEEIAPSQELVDKVKSFQSRKSVLRLKKGVIIPIAAAFAACLSITAAAVTGNIDFERIFGDRIYVADSELGAELAGSVKDVSYTVSDDAYKVSVAGVTGSSNRLYAVIEISRKDGTPVTEHFQNPTDDYSDCCYWLRDYVKIKPSTSWGGGIGTKINSDGNIVYTADIYADEPINGSVVTAEGDTLLLNSKYLEIKERENIYYGMQRGKWGFYSYETNEPQETDISSAIALPLKWSIKFRYIPSEKSLSVLTCRSPKEKTVIYMNSSAYDECRVKSIEVSSTGGKMEIEYCEKSDSDELSARPVNCNEVYLVMKDGSKIPISINGYKDWFKNGCEHKELNLEYKLDDDKYMIRYTDISEASALSFNGVIYELK